MHLSFQEIRPRAAAFSERWRDASYEKGDTQSFYNDLFDVFGISRRKVASFETPVKKLGDKQGFIDLFWKGTLLVEQKSAGRDLVKAKSQAFDYFPNLKPHDLPRYILLSDFQNFELYDLDENTEVKFPLADFHKHIEKFGFMIGVQIRTFKDQDPVNVEAANLMARLHDTLRAVHYEGHDLERFLVRLVFCLFADDTGIFPRDSFNDLLLQTNEDGTDVGLWMYQLFEILNTPETKRQTTLREELRVFPYINGQLFAERLGLPAFNAKMRLLLLEACDFNWDAISPAIFGSLFQSVMDVKERRKKGAHYTTEMNIRKLIEPLFMDDLRAEFNKLKALKRNRQKELEGFHDRLSKLTFFDPACGSGNFLIIAYRELRILETELLRELHSVEQIVTDISYYSKVNVDQFYGIEIEEFSSLIAETAMWMMDHLMNNRLSYAFGQSYLRIPLKTSPHILFGDSLETDWEAFIKPEVCSYILGNPPFVGQSYQSPKQRAQMRAILGSEKAGSLDYVGAWFLKAAQFLQKSEAAFAFVATNSLTQGEQVAQIWTLLFDKYKLELAFAHRTFEWGSEAPGKAHVHVVILGLIKRSQEREVKRLFSYADIKGEPKETQHTAISPYLFDAGNLKNRYLVLTDLRKPINNFPIAMMGTKPVDNGNYIFKEDEKSDFLKLEPSASQFFRPFIGSEEYINGISRWILHLEKATPQQLRSMPHILSRIKKVKEFRLNSQKPATRKLAEYPTKFEQTVIPDCRFMLIPETSSETRNYIPLGCVNEDVIPSNSTRIAKICLDWHFALLTSRMHMAWMRQIGGRLKSDYRYSIGLVYNTFPVPPLTDNDRAKLDKLAQGVLDARSLHGSATLADLYDPDTMPPNLRKAHLVLDKAVDRLYSPIDFESDRQRVEHLFQLYEKTMSPLLAQDKQKHKKH